MNNYQLYRTNVSLGGQLKWDVILSNDQNTLFVSNFNLSPISDNCAYNALTHNLLNTNHQDNLRMYYAKNAGDFYSSNIDANFAHNYPLLVNDNSSETIYYNVFDAGCKRTKSYSKYKKQFEFLCPLWLEHVTAPIKFKISLLDSKNKQTMAAKTLSLDIIGKHNIHNNFVKYLNNYIQYLGIDNGNDNVLNINFNDNNATLSGIDVKNGITRIANLYDIVSNITARERPLMEVDNMLMTSFENNDMLCAQLFNFNLCFNIEDILTGSIAKMFMGKNIIVTVDVYVGDNLLEKRDFYTEYEYLSKEIIGDTNNTYNVLDYLHDNENIALIDKNKFCQNICHWSLHDNNDYIFNVYEGFAGVKVEDGVEYINEHQYANTSNLTLKTYNPSQNSAGWINAVNIDNWGKFYDKYIVNLNINKTDGIYVGDNKFINNVKYGYICKAFDNTYDGFYLLGIKCSDKLLMSIVETFKSNCYNIYNKDVYVLQLNDLVMILTNNYDYLSFGMFMDILNNYKSTNNTTGNFNINTFISELLKMLRSVTHPHVIKFNKSLQYSTVDTIYGSVLDISEKVYYKDDSINVNNYIVRYDGNIKPTLVDSSYTNTLYYKDCILDDVSVNSVYTTYSKLGEPLYPSIEYCAIRKIPNWDYNKPPKVIITAKKDNADIYENMYEYKWFNSNLCLVLDTDITVKVINNQQYNGTYLDLDTIISNIISEYYGIDISDTKYISYIKSLYNYTNDWSYANSENDNNIIDYEYNIHLELK